jgi:hypothetical protein
MKKNNHIKDQEASRQHFIVGVKAKVFKNLFFLIVMLAGMQLFAQPINDDCYSAISIIPGQGFCSYNSFTTIGATASAGVPAPTCGNYAGGDVWFKVVVPASGHLIFDSKSSNSSFDASMAIYSGTCAALTEIECDADDSSNGLMPAINNASLTPGSIVYIRFWQANGGAGEAFELCVYDTELPPCQNSTPAADYCSTATPINNLTVYCGSTYYPYTAYVSPNDSTDEDNAPLGGVFCGSIENNSWLSFIACTKNVSLNIIPYNCLNNLGIQVEIYGTSDCYNFTPVSNCWNAGTATSGTVNATGLTIGQTYYIMIDGQAGELCDYLITSVSGISVVDAGPPVSLCTGESTILHGSGGTTFSWSPTTGLSDPNIANPVASPGVTTTYTLTVTGSTICQGTDTVTVTVNPIPVAQLTVTSATFCRGNSIQLNASGGTSYLWIPSAGLNSSTISNPVATPLQTTIYTVVVSDTTNCYTTATVDLTVQTQTADENQQICLVTVDSTTQKNKVMWNKDPGMGTTSFNIYKEISLNNYSLIGNVPYSNPGYYIDMTSVPSTHADKYKMGVVDTGNCSSNLSPYHQTMNLVVSVFGSTMGLSWSSYIDESGTFIPAMFYIFRGNQANNLQLYDSISSSFTSYNDNNITTQYYYAVAVKKSPACIGSKSNASYSFSNIRDNGLNGVGELSVNDQMSIFPNPFDNTTTIEFPNADNSEYSMTVTDIMGKIVMEDKISSGSIFLNRNALESGMYFIELKGEKDFIGKLFIE